MLISPGLVLPAHDWCHSSQRDTMLDGTKVGTLITWASSLWHTSGSGSQTVSARCRVPQWSIESHWLYQFLLTATTHQLWGIFFHFQRGCVTFYKAQQCTLRVVLKGISRDAIKFSTLANYKLTPPDTYVIVIFWTAL